MDIDSSLILAGIVIVLIVIALFGGFIGGWWMKGFRQDKQFMPKESFALLDKQLKEEKDKSQNLQEQVSQLEKTHASIEAQKKSLENEKQNFSDFIKQTKDDFQILANNVLETKSQKFSESSKKELAPLLNPLNETIKDFKTTFTHAYSRESQERNSLKGEIKNIIATHNKTADSANNLAKALREDSKERGNWGEFMAEKILEEAGLRRELDFSTQKTSKEEFGDKNLRPDIVINLPNDRHIIIDSKTTLISYEQYHNQDEQNNKKEHLETFIKSVRDRIKELGQKDYQRAQGVKGLDFVLMFMPIEGAFLLVQNKAPLLLQEAMDKKIVIVSPAILFSVVKAIAFVLRQERQNRNAEEIAKQAGMIYDKIVGFLENMQKIGRGIEASKNNYDDAMKKLSTGKGNLLQKTEKLKALGASTTKPISLSYEQEIHPSDKMDILSPPSLNDEPSPSNDKDETIF